MSVINNQHNINNSNFINISAAFGSGGLFANGSYLSETGDLSVATVDKISHPQFWFVLPEPADGSYSYSFMNRGKKSPWKVDVSRVGSQYVVHAQINGKVSLIDFLRDLDSLPQSFGSGENFINHLYNDGHVYFTADNALDMNLTNPEVKGLTYAGMEAKHIYNILDFSGQTQTASGVFGTLKSANNQNTDVYASSNTVLYQSNNEFSLRFSLNNATPRELHNFYALMNVPKEADKDHFAINLAQGGIQVVNAVTNQQLAGVRILVSQNPAKLQSTAQPDLSAYVDPATVSDWSTIQSIYVEVPEMAPNELNWVIVKGSDASGSLVKDIGKAAVVEGMFGTDSMLPSVLDGANATRLKISDNVNIHQRLHYVDTQGQEHYVNLDDINLPIGRRYNLLDPNNVSQIPTGYQVKRDAEGNWAHSVINGAKTWHSDEDNGTLDLSSPITYYADDDTVQYELEAAQAAQIKVQYVDTTDPLNYKVLQTITVDGYGNTALSDENKTAISSPYQSFVKQGYHYDSDFSTTMVTNGVADQNNSYYKFKTSQDKDGKIDGLDLSAVKYATDGTTPVYIIPINKLSDPQNIDPNWYPRFSSVYPASSVAPVNSEMMDLQQIDYTDLSVLSQLFQFNTLRQLPNGNYVLAISADTIANLSQSLTQHGIKYQLTQENGILTFSMDLADLNYGSNMVTGDSDDPAEFTPWHYYDTGQQDENGNEIW